MPVAVIVPSKAFQTTAVFDVVPATVALNCSVPPVIDEAVPGSTVTLVTPGEPTPGGGVAPATATVAVADFVGSATLVAVTVSAPALAGAV